MKRIAKLIGTASVLGCAMLVLTVFSSNGQSGKPISNAQAATIRGGCGNASWGKCQNGSCTGQIVTAPSTCSANPNGNNIYCCNGPTCSNCTTDCE